MEIVRECEIMDTGRLIRGLSIGGLWFARKGEKNRRPKKGYSCAKAESTCD